jgi:nitrate reductase cytochrome c-type subunit
MKMAADEVEMEFERRGCITCHRVRDTRNADLAERFEVEPIRLRNEYFPTARFPHRSHLIQNGVDGDGACLTCHPAKDAEVGGASQLLLPEISNCEGCHSDRPARDRTRLQCVSCHAYHSRT